MKKTVWMIIFLLFVAVISTGCSEKKQAKKQKVEETAAYQIEQMVLQEDGSFEYEQDSAVKMEKKETLQDTGRKCQKIRYLLESYCVLLENGNQEELIILNQDLKQTDTITFKKEEKKAEIKDFYISEDKQFHVVSVKNGEECEVLYYDQYDWEGKNLCHLELGEYSVFAEYMAVEDGCFLYDNKKFILYDKNGKQAWEKPAGKIQFDAMMQGEDGDFYILSYGENQVRNLIKMDSKTGKVEGEFETELNFNRIPELFQGKTEGQIYICDEQKGIYCYDMKTKTSDVVVDYLDLGIGGLGCKSVCAWQEDCFLCLLKKEGEWGLYSIVPGKKVEKEILTVGVRYTEDVVFNMVNEFNQQNEDVELEIRDYSEYTDPITQMQLDVTTGDCPDILDATMMDTENLIKKGVLVDIYPFMEKDPEMHPEKFVDSVLRLLEHDGKLYVLPMRVWLNYIVCDQQTVPKKETVGAVSLELMEQLQKENPDKVIFNSGTWSNFFNNVIHSGEIERFFASEEMKEEFSRLLKFTKGLSKMEDNATELMDKDLYQAVRKKRLLFWEINSGGAAWYETMQFRDSYGKEKYTFCGYPCTQGSGVWMTTVTGDSKSCFGISISCKNKEAAWQFIRSFLTEEKQEEIMSSLPIRKEALEKLLREKRNYGGKETAMTKKERKQYLELVDAADYFLMPYGIQGDLAEIVWEEVQAYFSDEKTLEETVDIIQSRVNLCASEQD